MAHVVDVRQSGGEFIVLGNSLTLPTSTGTAGALPLAGSLRYNPQTRRVEAFLPLFGGNGLLSYDWRWVGDGDSNSNQFVRVNGDRMFGDLVFNLGSQLRAANGTTAAPGLSFDGGQTSGFYWDGGALGVSVSGQARLSIGSSTDVIGDLVLTAGGTAIPLRTTNGALVIAHTGGVVLPGGDDSQRPFPVAGLLRFSSASNALEFHNGTAWLTMATAGYPNAPFLRVTGGSASGAFVLTHAWNGNPDDAPLRLFAAEPVLVLEESVAGGANTWALRLKNDAFTLRRHAGNAWTTPLTVAADGAVSTPRYGTLHDHFLAKAGDTMTGTLTIRAAGTDALVVEATAGPARVALRQGGGAWAIQHSGTGRLDFVQTPAPGPASGPAVTPVSLDADGTVHATIFAGLATSAEFGDVAERYAADRPYAPGTVVVIGGDAEVTACTRPADPAVAGVLSTAPALRMNDAAGNDATHPFVALRGRVPCKVVGPVGKGDRLVTSATPGHAQRAAGPVSPGALVGKALQSFEGASGVIEVLV